jgi:preprotein translocase subunit SecA
MDYLQEGIGLRGYGQRDPVVEYQREAFDMFGAMMEGIKEESVGFLFNLEVEIPEETPEGGAQPTQFSQQTQFSGTTPLGGEIGVRGEPVPSSAPAAFVDSPESQQSAAAAGGNDERARVADVLGQVLGQPKRPASLQYSAPTVDGEGGVTRSREVTRADGSSDRAQFGDVARNAPCPCGSGRKYKRCHGAPESR